MLYSIISIGLCLSDGRRRGERGGELVRIDDGESASSGSGSVTPPAKTGNINLLISY